MLQGWLCRVGPIQCLTLWNSCFMWLRCQDFTKSHDHDYSSLVRLPEELRHKVHRDPWRLIHETQMLSNTCLSMFFLKEWLHWSVRKSTEFLTDTSVGLFWNITMVTVHSKFNAADSQWKVETTYLLLSCSYQPFSHILTTTTSCTTWQCCVVKIPHSLRFH